MIVGGVETEFHVDEVAFGRIWLGGVALPYGRFRGSNRFGGDVARVRTKVGIGGGLVKAGGTFLVIRPQGECQDVSGYPLVSGIQKQQLSALVFQKQKEYI